MDLLELQQYLQNLADLSHQAQQKRQPNWQYKSFEELILKYGREMKPKPRPADIKQGLPQSCYYNCALIALQRKDLTYCEGYTASSNTGIPLKHSWLMDLEGKAIEITWETPGTVYFGIPFKTQWLRSLLKFRREQGNDKDFSIFESNYLEDYSLLIEGLPTEAIKANI